MDLREQILRHRKDGRVIGAGLAALFVLCSLFYYLLLRGRGLPQELLANRVLLFALWYVNVILILTVVFILVRNGFRLLLERRNRILGSRFKTKLVLTAIGLSLIPVLILFPFATRLLVDSFESFFTLPVEDVLEPAAAMAGALVDEIEATSGRAAGRVLADTITYDLEDLGERPALAARLQELRDELGLDYLAIFDGTEPIHSVADPVAGFSRDVVFRNLERLLREAIAEGEVSHIEDAAGVEGRLILAGRAGLRPADVDANADEDVEAPAADAGAGAATEPRYTVVVAGRVLPPDLAGTAAGLERAYQAYLQLVAQKEGLRTQYLQTLLMVTLLVILAFSSIGLRLARRVTAPIQALADGTRRISSGDLDHRVEVPVDDELAVLVDAFNSMTGELKSHRELVDRSNRQLVAANRRLAAILDNVAAGVLTLDRDGRVVTCNEAALSILAQREADVVGRTVDEAWGDRERDQLAALLRRRRSDRTDTAELRITLGGVYKTLEVKITPLPAAEGVGGGRVVVLEDLTELIQAQKMATWHEVARRIAHEIKNPLTPIKLTAERLLRRHQQNDPQLGRMLEEGVEIIAREVDSMKAMVDEFSRFARMPQPRPRQVDLAALVGDTLSLYQSVKPGVEVAAEIDPAAREARFDPEQLRSVLINLLDNAIEATDPPGRVTVSTLPQNGQVLVQVRDTGRGVRPEDKEKLFLPYFSTKGRGTGLGLAIVHRLVHDNFAALRVEDNQPRGTVFTVEIPVH